jgi:hypothetical protein
MRTRIVRSFSGFYCSLREAVGVLSAAVRMHLMWLLRCGLIGYLTWMSFLIIVARWRFCWHFGTFRTRRAARALCSLLLTVTTKLMELATKSRLAREFG